MQNFSLPSWIVFGASVLVTLVVWGGFFSVVEESKHNQFLDGSKSIVEDIEDRLKKYEDVLIGIKGLYAASEHVSLEEWNAFVLSQELEEKFPGIQGVGFVEFVSNDSEYGALISDMRNQGVDDYKIKPEGTRSQYFPVTYLYPDDIRNRQAVGYDIYSETIRASAVDTAIETKEMTITGKIILVQEIDENIQNGFLMLLPIYDGGKLQGMAYTVFRINDLMAGILDKNTLEQTNVKFYDDVKTDENLFFDSNDLVFISDLDMDYMYDETLEFGNRDWYFVLESKTPVISSGDMILLWSIPLIGFSMSVLVFFILLNFNKTALAREVQHEKNAFDAMISHELKTPLVPIRGYCDMLLEPGMIGELNPDQKRAVEKIVSNTGHLLELIQKILTSQRLELGKYYFNYEKIPVSSLMNEMYDSHKQMMVDKNIQFENQTAITDELNTDKNQLKEVFTNIIQNAVDFVPKGGEIIMSAKKENNSVVFAISNNGPLISKENQKKLFQKFYQVDTSLTRKHGGSGLGLAVCRGLIEGFGGKIWVQSDVEHGTTFFFKVPLAGNPEKDKSMQ